MNGELRPVCFIAMPFGVKKVSGAREGAPVEVNFDQLWDKAYRPAMEDAGYTPVRADFDTGALIIKDMLERLAYSDLVLADMSLPNGNVYYEVGLRHVAREQGCILYAADWSRQLFDIDQFTTIRYQLTDGDIPDNQAEALRKTVADSIQKFKGSFTPWHDTLRKNEGVSTNNVFKEQARKLSEFQADLRALRLESDAKTRKAELAERVKTLQSSATMRLPQAAVEMIVQVRDHLGDWSALVKFIDGLDRDIRAMPFVQEQRLLALAKNGDPALAAASLEELIENHGGSPERYGLLGGRLKTLWRQARDDRLEKGIQEPSRAERKILNNAIVAYEMGTQMDLNEFYPACNLALLLTARNKNDDLDRAQAVDRMVIMACDRALKLGIADNWTPPTLLGAAFRSSDIDEARKWLERVEEDGAEYWKLDTTLPDLQDFFGLLPVDARNRDALAAILEELKELVAEAADG